MNILAISGSPREGSTNTHLLLTLANQASSYSEIEVYESIGALPIFSPDIDADAAPENVKAFASAVAAADGLIISSPEYVRAIPGGLKNAIDWLVPREELVNKPIALVHASHRGDDMLSSLRLVLNTVTSNFDEESFLQFPLMSKSPDEVRAFLFQAENAIKISEFLSSFHSFILTVQAQNKDGA